LPFEGIDEGAGGRRRSVEVHARGVNCGENGIRIGGVEVAQKRIGIPGDQTEWCEDVGREVLQVERQNCLCAGVDCGSQDMAVAGI
jgi:hypothetical protein